VNNIHGILAKIIVYCRDIRHNFAPDFGADSRFVPYNQLWRTLMNELARALIGNSAFAPVANVLQGIPESAAHLTPSAAAGSAPHSIYDEVWHLAFWQDITLDWVEGKPTPYPIHAAEGFPNDQSETWESLRERFLACTQNAAAIANDIERLEIQVACPRPNEPNRTMTVREQLESLAAHNGYHLGRIVLLRQLQGNWPPPDGGDSW
jgi:uncharacterized damage-inducible protein DinB